MKKIKNKKITKKKITSKSYRAQMYQQNEDSIKNSIMNINLHRNIRKRDRLPAGTTYKTAGWYIETEKWLKSIGCGDVELALVMYGMITSKGFNVRLNSTSTTTTAQTMLKANAGKMVRGLRGKLPKRKITYYDVLKNPNSQLYAYTVLFQIDFVFDEGNRETTINNIIKDAQMFASFVNELHFENTKSIRKLK